MLIVGLTGSIACGKSTVTTRLRQKHGLTVIDLDDLARRVVEPGRQAYAKIVEAFGKKILTPNGQIDRDKLGALVFSDRSLRKKLNSITHWPILWALLKNVAAARATGVRIVVLDAPLLFETKLNMMCGATVVVHIEEATQLSRLQARDNSSKEEAERRVAAQMPLQAKMARATHLIDNNGRQRETYERVATIVTQLGARAEAWSLWDLLRSLWLSPLLALVAAIDLTLEQL